MLHPDAPDGKALKYSHRERERRFLLTRLPNGEIVRTVAIEDLYIRGTRLRVRKLVDQGRAHYKFTQKIPDPDGEPGLITTLYISTAEYELLSTLPGDRLRKVRYSIPPMGFDVFEGPLTGLFMGEMEFTDDHEIAAFAAPPGTVAEVTHDRRFTGGELVRTTQEELRVILRGMGVHGNS